MNKNTIYVSKPSLPNIEDYNRYIKQIWESAHLTNSGPLHRQFESNLIEYLNAKQVSLFTNGHLALEAALQVLELKGEVITTPFTFASTAHAISRIGLKPVFCDIHPENFNINPNEIEALITEETSAILAVHVFGVPCDVEAIQTIANKYNLKVIYDAAHAFGVTYKEKPISSYGDISMFSFHATKVFHSIEGGALVYNDASLKRKIEKIKNFGIESEDMVDVVGFNGKMNEFQAAMGLLNLDRIAESLDRRKYVVEKYNSLLEKHQEIIKPMVAKDSISNYAYYPIIIKSKNKKRNQVHEFLKTKGIVSRKYFYPLCSDFECYANFKVAVPVAESTADSILVLPLYESLTNKEIIYICNSLELALRETDFNE